MRPSRPARRAPLPRRQPGDNPAAEASVNATMADLGRSLGSPFRDPAWPARTLVGAALEIGPFLVALPLILRVVRRGFHLTTEEMALLGFASLVALVCRWIGIGYLRRLAEGVLAGADEALPRWDRFGEDLLEGFKLWLISLGAFLPAIGTAAALAFTTAALGAPRLAWVPVALVLPPLALLTLFYLPAALLAAVARGDAGAAFDVGRVLATVAGAPAHYLLAFVVALMALLLAQLGFLLLCVGVFATRFLAGCIAVHAFAGAWAECRRAAEPPA